jgi:hypothetical protein
MSMEYSVLRSSSRWIGIRINIDEIASDMMNMMK